MVRLNFGSFCKSILQITFFLKISDLCIFLVSFRFKEHLNKHIQIKHGDSPCICEVCAKLFRSEMALRLHMKTHAPKGNQPKVQCETCGAWLCNRYGLKTHMLLHTSKPQKCKICGKFSPTPNALRVCWWFQPKGFKRITILLFSFFAPAQVHMNNIHRERTHQCHLCDKKFKNDAVLKVNWNLKCEIVVICLQIEHVLKAGIFAFFLHFQGHIAVHTGGRFICTFTMQSLKNALYWKKITISGERPFNCSFCPQTFVWRQDMYNHRKKFHPDEWSQCKQTRVTPKWP